MAKKDAISPTLILGVAAAIGGYFLWKSLEKPPEDEIPPDDEINAQIKDYYVSPSIETGKIISTTFIIKNTGRTIQDFYFNTIFEGETKAITGHPNMLPGEERRRAVGIWLPDDFPTGNYDVGCKLWKELTGGQFIKRVDDFDIYYRGRGVLSGLLDEKWGVVKVTPVEK